MAKQLVSGVDNYVVVGPFFEVANGYKCLSSLTATNDVATLVCSHHDNSTTCTHTSGTCSTTAGDDWGLIDAASGHGSGVFQLKIPAASIPATGGHAKLTIIDEDVHIPVWEEYEIVCANVMDSQRGTDLLDVNQAQYLGTACHAASEAGTGCVEVVRWSGQDVHATTVNGVPVVQLHENGGGGGINAPLNFEDLSIVDTTGLVAVPTTQKVDVETIKTNAVVNGGTVTFPTNATLAKTGDSMLITPGTNAGQLDVTSGVVKANLVQILASALSGTAAQIAAAFVKFFDKASPTGTVNSLPDAVAGANGGLPTTNGTKVSQTVDLTAGQSIAVSGDLSSTMKTSVENAVLDADVSTHHTTSGTAGAKINAAGNAGDPWGTALPGEYSSGEAGYIIGNMSASADPWNVSVPGAYAAGKAGYILGTNLDAKVSDVKTNTDLIADANYGLAKLVRSTTPTNTLSVDANHLVAVPATQKVDVETVKTQAVTCAAGVTVLASVGHAGAPGAANGALTTNGTKVNQTVDLTASQKIDLVDAPNATAVTAFRTEMEKSGTTLATLLARIIGTLDTGTHKPQSGDAYATATNATYGLSALKVILDAIAGYVDTEIATVDTVVDAIRVVTDRLNTALFCYDIENGYYDLSSARVILNKLGAISYSDANNTVLGYFKALLSKAADTPSDIGGTFSAATDSTEAIRDATINADIKKINAKTVTGDGSVGNPWGPA